MRVLVVDNYDSFVYNLVQYLAQLGADPVVLRNDADGVVDLVDEVDGVLVSPGPGTPDDAGASNDVIRRCAAVARPVLGVCLGHQALGAVHGAVVERAPELRHGKTSLVHHEGAGVLAGLRTPFTATRYHSLTVRPDTLPAELEPTGWTDDGVLMAMRHRELPLEGVQFHPESVLTEDGHRLLATWMDACGHPVDDGIVHDLTEGLRALALAPPRPPPTGRRLLGATSCRGSSTAEAAVAPPPEPTTTWIVAPASASLPALGFWLQDLADLRLVGDLLRGLRDRAVEAGLRQGLRGLRRRLPDDRRHGHRVARARPRA